MGRRQTENGTQLYTYTSKCKKNEKIERVSEAGICVIHGNKKGKQGFSGPICTTIKFYEHISI
jgi:hypothetical protein